MDMHRKSRAVPIPVFRHVVTMVMLAAMAAGLVILTFVMASAANAATVTATPHSGEWWDLETCHDFTLYEHGERSFAEMLRHSRHADIALKLDLINWNADRDDSLSPAYLAADRGYLALDCIEVNLSHAS